MPDQRWQVLPERQWQKEWMVGPQQAFPGVSAVRQVLQEQVRSL